MAYYRDDKPFITDKQYDELYDELEALENETGIIFSSSPTQKVGYDVLPLLNKSKHTHPMLSLAKTKSVEDLVDFFGNRNCLLSLKMDGLTICLTYDNGKLIKAETRGNGEIGEDITHNAKVFDNIPLSIGYKGYFEIEGEAIITYDDFEKINSSLSDDQKYKTPRNLAAGSVRQLDSGIAASRHLKFIAWKVPLETYKMTSGLQHAEQLGFTIVPYAYLWESQPHVLTKDKLIESFQQVIKDLKETAHSLKYPIDGLVLSYDDVEFGKSLGMTGHHPKHSIAFKFYDEEENTILREIEWSGGKTGVLTPVAVFDPVELDGTTVSRASLHNVSILKQLELGIGDEITVYKSNQIIPQIRENITKSNSYIIPTKCPICGGNTSISKDNNSEILVCINPMCKSKLVKRLSHFVSRQAMNIDGLSEETLAKFVEWGWVSKLSDIYFMDQYFEKLSCKPGFGEKSVNKLKQAIENSKTVALDHFITALSIPGIGNSQAKVLSEYLSSWDKFQESGNSDFNFSQIEGIGEVLNKNIHNWFKEMYISDGISELVKILNIESGRNTSDTKRKIDLTFVITGNLNHFSSRDILKNQLESMGAKVASAVSSKTDYLVNNDITSNSSKNKKAKELGVPIITEDQLIKMINEE